MGIPLEYTIYLWGLVGVLLCWALVQYQAVVGYLLGACGLIVVLYLLGSAVFKLDRVDRDRILAALFLIALQPLFWALFEQAGSSLRAEERRLGKECVSTVRFGWAQDHQKK